MAVKVYGGAEWHEYASGLALEVRDGHLFVLDTTSTVMEPQHQIAVYVPGKWERVEITR
ncbi:MAG TPA: hypothetical protein VGD91_25525 [Trebonia sp.]